MRRGVKEGEARWFERILQDRRVLRHEKADRAAGVRGAGHRTAREERGVAPARWRLASPVIPTPEIIFTMSAAGDARKKSIALLNYPTLRSPTPHPTGVGVPEWDKGNRTDLPVH